MLLDKIKDKIEAKVACGGALVLKAAAFSKAMASKKDRPPTKKTYWDRIILQKIAKKIGLDQVDIMASGASPLNCSTKDFIIALVGAPVVECYGSFTSIGYPLGSVRYHKIWHRSRILPLYVCPARTSIHQEQVFTRLNLSSSVGVCGAELE